MAVCRNSDPHFQTFRPALVLQLEQGHCIFLASRGPPGVGDRLDPERVVESNGFWLLRKYFGHAFKWSLRALKNWDVFRLSKYPTLDTVTHR